MPETNFKIRWPNGTEETCYSPSLVVKKYFQSGERYSVHDFLMRSRESLQIASDRVYQKYGFPCSRALGQLQKIEAAAQPYLDDPEGQVTLLEFEDIP